MRTLEDRVHRLKANAELQRIAAAYSGYLSGAQYENILGLFSARADVWASMPWGTYRGQDGLKRLYPGLYSALYRNDGGMKPGVLTVHGVNTPVITVAEDGKTAQALWTSPGVFTVEREGAPNGLQSYWSWQKAWGDFVREGEAWKLLHLRIAPLFTTEFEKSWTEEQTDVFASIPPALQADAPAMGELPPPEPHDEATVGGWAGNPWEDTEYARITRLELIAGAQRLMGLYSNFMAAKQYGRIPALFALETPTVRAEMLWGVYEREESIRKLYTDLFPHLTENVPGRIASQVQSLEVPIITAAKDCQTAKGVWVSPGFMNIRNPDGTETGCWSWQKYAADFIRTEQGLKIWHLHVYGLFESEYGSEDIHPAGTFGMDIPPALTPDRAPTTPFRLSADSVYPYEPAVPKPYSVYDPDYGY